MLEATDYDKRVIFAQWTNSLPKSDLQFMNFSDEAYFYLTESLNKQNNRMWLKERPVDWIERSLQDNKFWFGVRFPPKKFLDYIFSKRP